MKYSALVKSGLTTEVLTENMKEKYKEDEALDGKKISSELKKLSKREREKIYYMIKGAAVVRDYLNEK